MAMKKVRWMASLLSLAVLTSIARPESRRIEGIYRNPALGYSVKVPHGLKAIAGDRAGPERGLRISLPSGGEIVVFGEPNSAEWKSPEEGVKMGITRADCTTDHQQIKQVTVGQLKGAETSYVCGDRVLKVLLAFRRGGGPIYWLRLDTPRSHQAEDEAILDSVAASLKQIRWE